MRLFIAIPIPTDIAQKIASILAKLADTRADIRWVPSESLHITIKFLGQIDDLLVPRISDRLSASAAQVPAFPLEVEGIDRFPEKGPTRIVISRIVSPDQRLTKLHRLIDSSLASAGIGIQLDTRVLVPHVTLGRINSNHALNRLLRLLQKHDLDFFGSFTVTHATLFQSTPAPGGSLYSSLHSAPLAASPALAAASPHATSPDAHP